MNGELVSTTTSDYVRLHGFYQRSQSRLMTSAETGSVDAAVLLHGLGGNFYSSRLLLHFSRNLLKLGVSVVNVNTRGHDMINISTWGGRARSVGAALENVGDASLDINAWVEFLIERGHSNVLLFGHSLGAIKSLYMQAHDPHGKVRSIVGLSATRLSYAKLIDSPRGDLFRDTVEHCKTLIEQQRGEDPIHVPFPFPTWMTPRCYVDKYGPAETYNWMKFIDKVDVPTLLLFGQKELDDDPAFEGLREELAPLLSGWNPLTIEEIEAADHFYTSQFDVVDDVISRWLTH
jgi:pimeloyl-ACP methyl ester carboxylesterase